ncbi:MAG: hypothetical protein CM15mP25_4340 [Gammaproteobacteria bacterium]|nr:MAG: hypothetical protein CM15mP25_4340 [Gammaproteobacteria bacterium]
MWEKPHGGANFGTHALRVWAPKPKTKLYRPRGPRDAASGVITKVEKDQPGLR